MLLPDHETAVDFLNYEAISKTVVELLRDNREPFRSTCRYSPFASLNL